MNKAMQKSWRHLMTKVAPCFPCGHGKTKANTRRFKIRGVEYTRCLTCHRGDNRAWHFERAQA